MLASGRGAGRYARFAWLAAALSAMSPQPVAYLQVQVRGTLRPVQVPVSAK